VRGVCAWQDRLADVPNLRDRARSRHRYQHRKKAAARGQRARVRATVGNLEALYPNRDQVPRERATAIGAPWEGKNVEDSERRLLAKRMISSLRDNKQTQHHPPTFTVREFRTRS
jgi:hypothetical protein